MPRRSSTRIAVSAAVAPDVPQVQLPLDPVSENFKNLRQHWKWAAFCQFYYVFFDLFNINDVSVEDIENDLIHGTDVFLPRIMQRLLFTLSYDRKISLDNWQNALRRQYDRRNPEANPLGSPSTVQTATNSRHTSVFKDEGEELDPEDHENKENGVEEGQEDAEAKDTTDTASKDEGATSPKATKMSERAASTTEERVTVDWSELTMDQKLESLHTVIEWQFQNPLRLRQLMKTDDEGATWRSEPVGYDKEANAYWLMGGNRLWIQRAPPKPPTRKRKRKAEPEPKSRGGAKSKRQRTSKSQSSTKSKAKTKAKLAPKAKEPPPTPITGRSSRAAKEQAKVKLDAQAKALEEFKRETAGAAASSSTPGRATRSRQAASKPAPAPALTRQTAGTRISARLRGAQQDDEWQKIPDDWLADDKNAKTGLESDGEASELTELSDEEREEEPEEEPEEDQKEEEPEKEEEEPALPKADFIEWETLCVTLVEWETFPERFAKSTYYAEKAFYKLLTTVIVPEVVAELRAIDQKRRMEEALNHRKRSSRLATRENEKEAAKIAAQQRAEEEEKMSRTRRLEARQQREEAERLKREKAREERRLKRETRIVEQETEETPEEEQEEQEQPPPQPQQPEQRPKRAATKREHDVPQAKAEPRKRVRSQTKKTAKANDDWELNCEVCGMTGKNLDDGKPMMCCGLCNKWQHIPCHDSRDARMGRPKRDWNKIDFFCARCLATKANGAHSAHHSSSSHRYQQHNHAHGGTNGVSHVGQLPYGQVAGQQSSWQPPAVSYNLKPAASGAQGYPEPSAYAQSYLAPTSSVRSSTYGHHPGHAQQHTASVHGQGYGGHGQGYGAAAYGGGNISFSHYQPQERVFTSEAERAAHHGQQNSYYRMNGHNGYGYPHQQTYPSQQHGWTGSGSHHYASGTQSYPASSAAASMSHRPAAYDSSSAQRSTYDSLARDAQAYRQQQQPTPPAPMPVQGQTPVPAPPVPTTANGHYDRGAASYPPPAA